VSAVFEAGTVTALMGPNGSGKSTLLEVIATVLPASSGVVNGVRTGHVAFVPQRADVSAHLPVTVAVVVTMGRWRVRGLWRPIRRADRVVVDEVIDLLGLTDLRDRPLDTLSGGQRQRTLVAQGLSAQAQLLLLDEPTAGVDSESAAVIEKALRTSADSGAIVIHATHDRGAPETADALLRLMGGRLDTSAAAHHLARSS
jgi:zinc/manganese transport system ATP-binding protein